MYNYEVTNEDILPLSNFQEGLNVLHQQQNTSKPKFVCHRIINKQKTHHTWDAKFKHKIT